jgi:hypothetical protein
LKAGLREQLFQFASAFWATGQRLITDFLHYFQLMSAFRAGILVNWHVM